MTVFLRRALLFSVVPLVLTGCTPGTPGEGNDNQHEHTVNLKFAANVGGDTATCGQNFTDLGTSGATAQIADLRFFVSNVRMINQAGEELPVTLDQDGTWQVEDVALLDFENGLGKCSDTGNNDVRSKVTGTSQHDRFRGVAFDLGIPFDLNHEDLTAAPSPLNVSAMYWTWATGHQFLRVDIETDANQFWSMHLGSTMCESSTPLTPPAAECGHPNRPQITLDGFDPDLDTIVLDLRALFAASDLTQDTPDSSAGCQSTPDDVNECTPLFPVLGLDFATGQCTNNCSGQTAFRVQYGLGSPNDAAAIARGMTRFTTPANTVGAGMVACASCHGNDGTGGIGPDIRSSVAAHFKEHAQGDGPHPDGTKFPELTDSDFTDIASYLTSLCVADPNCEPDSGEAGHHH